MKVHMGMEQVKSRNFLNRLLHYFFLNRLLYEVLGGVAAIILTIFVG